MRIRVLIAAILLCFTVGLVQLGQAQQDVNISGQNVYQVLARGAAWGSSNQPTVPGNGGGVNNNFLFQSVNPNTQVCLYIRNNNPSNAHSVTVQMWQAGDPSVKVFTSDSSAWNQASTLQNSTVSISAKSTAVWYFNVSAGAMLAAKISGSVTAGGSPDTADIIADQTTSGQCGVASSANFVGGSNATGVTPSVGSHPFDIAGVSSAGLGNVLTRYGIGTGSGNNTGFPLAESNGSVSGGVHQGNQAYLGSDNGGLPLIINTPWIFCANTKLCAQEDHRAGYDLQPSIGSSGSWNAQNSATNPGANADLLSLSQTGSGAGSPAYFLNAWLTCSAACEIQIFRVTTLGTTCTAITNVANPYLASGAAYGGQFSGAQGAINSACTTNPTTGALLWDLPLAANTPYQLDLRGFVCPVVVSSPCGIMFLNKSAVTGTVTVTTQWYEL